MSVVAGLRLAPRLGRTRAARAVGHPHPARLAVELKEKRRHAFVVGLADAEQADYQCLAPLDIEQNLVLDAHAVEIDRRRQDADRTVIILRHREVGKDLRIHQIRGKLGARELAAHLSLCLGAQSIEVGRLKKRAGTFRIGRLTLQRLLLQAFRPAARRLAEIAA